MNELYFDEDYLYHATPKAFLNKILKKGLIPKVSDGVTFAGNDYSDEPRCYLANSLIAAYDISQNFEAHGKGENYYIIKISREMLVNNGFILYEDLFFEGNGVYVDNIIPKEFFVGEPIYTGDLLNEFSDDDLEGLYY